MTVFNSAFINRCKKLISFGELGYLLNYHHAIDIKEVVLDLPIVETTVPTK